MKPPGIWLSSTPNIRDKPASFSATSQAERNFSLDTFWKVLVVANMNCEPAQHLVLVAVTGACANRTNVLAIHQATRRTTINQSRALLRVAPPAHHSPLFDPNTRLNSTRVYMYV